jgi:hypothetical protein
MPATRERLKIVDVTFTTDTAAYANNDLVADTQTISGAFYDIDTPGYVESVYLLDTDDNTAIPFIVFFLSGSGSLGSENGALNPTDAVALTVCGTIDIAAADFKDLINSKAATMRNLELPVKPIAGTRDLGIAVAIGTGTPTFTATGLKARIAIRS